MFQHKLLRRKKLSSKRRGTIAREFTAYSWLWYNHNIVLANTLIFFCLVLFFMFGILIMGLLLDNDGDNDNDNLHSSHHRGTVKSVYDKADLQALFGPRPRHGEDQQNEVDRAWAETGHFSALELNQTKPLDDYLNRQHISLTSLPIMAHDGNDGYGDGENIRDADLPILVIGGFDGSGTRAFVDMAARLGVPMVVDDTGTFDVHASCMFDGDGWPALIRTIFRTTHRANYSWNDFDLVQQSILQSTLERFADVYGKRGTRLREQGIQEGFPVASKVLYGFKAPVSMLALPPLRHVLGRIKFLHVVRDGRDVSLSKNKSPVQKFYHIFYENATQRQKAFESIEGDVVFLEAMAMQLWNDWNLQVLDWEHKYSDGQTFDYLVMRTEDLMDPRTRFTSLCQLADFVGSPKTESDLCCLSKQKIQDMGKSGVRKHKVAGLPAINKVSGLPALSPSGWWGQKMENLRNLILSGLRGFLLGLTGRDDQGGVDRIDLSEFHKRRKEMLNVALTGGRDVPFPDVVGIERERQRFLNNLRQQRPDLFQRIQLQRENQFKAIRELGEYENLAGSAVGMLSDNNDHDEEKRRRLLEEDEERYKGGALHMTRWRNTTRKPRMVVPVDHRKFDTMLERMKELELLAKKEHFLKHHSKVMAAVMETLDEETLDKEESPEQVMKRYGRWKTTVRDRPELNRILQEEGAAALQIFGYEPTTRFSDFPVFGECQALATCKSPPKPLKQDIQKAYVLRKETMENNY